MLERVREFYRLWLPDWGLGGFGCGYRWCGSRDGKRECNRQNSVSDIVKIRKGSIGDIRKRFDVVVANIDLRSLRRMRRPLLRHLKSKGFLILSGILEGDKDRLRQYYMETGS